MSLCSDPYIDILQETFQAIPLKVPDSRFKPFTVLKRKHQNKGTFSYLGHLSSIIGADVALPKIDEASVSEFTGKKSSTVKVGAGLEILADLLAIKQQLANLEIGFSQAKNVSFEFHNIKQHFVDVIQLGNVIRGLKLDLTNTVLKQDHLWIITSVLTSDQFQIHTDSNAAVNFSAEVPLTAKVTGAPVDFQPKFKVETNTNDNKSLTFKLGEPQTFAFTCLKLSFKDGKLGEAEIVERSPDGAKSPEGWENNNMDADSTPKLALLIGIDKYKYVNSLNGCINDVELVKDTLVHHYGFEEVNIECLLGKGDFQPTRANILAAFQRLIERAKLNPGAVVVLHYSGHGSIQPNKDKPTEQNETIVPCDSGRLQRDGGNIADDQKQGPVSTDITDIEIREFLLELANHSAHVAAVFDSCHSESIAREGEIVLANPSDTDRWVKPDSRLGELPESRGDVPPKKQANIYSPDFDNTVVIAACEYDKTAKELTKDKPYGVFTYYWTEVLKDTQPDNQSPDHQVVKSAAQGFASYEDIFDKVRSAVKLAGYPQNPNIEGAVKWSLFGTSKLDSEAFASVVGQRDDEVQLNIGAIHGVTVGSTFALYPGNVRTTRVAGLTPVTQATVTKVYGTTLWAKLANPKVEVNGCRAFETQRHGNKIKIYLPPDCPQSVKDILNQNYYEPVADVSQAMLILHHVIPPQDPSIHFNVNMPNVPVWVVTNNSHEVVLPLDVTDDAPQLAKNLVSYARYRTLLNSVNNGSELEDSIEFVMYVSKDKNAAYDEWPKLADDGSGEIQVGDFFRFGVRQTSIYPLYFAIIEFSENGKITQFYPLNKAAATEPLKANTSIIQVPFKKMFHMEGIDQTIPRPPNAPVACAYKLYVTTAPTSFTYLEQEGYSQTRVGNPTPLSQDDATKWCCKTIYFKVKH